MKNSNIARLISNYGNRLWNLVSVFIFIPFYIKILGIENYAIIGFYALLLGIISFADSGMSSAIIKEFSKNNSASYKYSIFRNIEKIYLFVCFIIMVIICLCSKFIAQNWLNSNTIEIEKLSYYVFLIGIGTVLQLLSSLYYGALFGLEEQVKSNFYQIVWNIFRAGIVILLLIFFSPTLETYFLWQIICNLFYIILLRKESVSILRKQDPNLQNYLKKVPKPILKYIGGMLVIAIISSVNIQADKIITSSVFSLKIFGYYNLASLLAQIPVILGAPLITFVFPLFSKFSFSDKAKLNITFDKTAYLLSLLIFPATLLLIFFPEDILKLWTGKNIETNMYDALTNVVRLLITGTLFLALQLPLFYLLLSKEKTKYSIYQGVIQVVFGLPLLYVCAKFYGLEAVPIPWILINLGSYIFSLFIVFNNFIDTKFLYYFRRAVVFPFFISLGVTFIFYLLHSVYEGNIIVYLVFSGILSIVVNIIVDNFLNKMPLKDITHLYNFPKTDL